MNTPAPTTSRTTTITRRATAVLAAVGIAAGSVLAAAPAQARDGTNMYVFAGPLNPGPVGVSTLNGWTFNPGTTSTRTDTFSSPWSARAVHTTPRWCVQENSSYWNVRDRRWRFLSDHVHTYNPATGGWSTLDAARFGEINGGEDTTKTTLSIRSCFG